MGFYVNPPADGFAEILADGLYVDKSELIGYTNDVLGTSRKLTASTRSRRFGKSFAAKMLAAYYSKGADSRELFENLKIADLDEKRRIIALTDKKTNKWKSVRFYENLNKYDVIYVDITSFT